MTASPAAGLAHDHDQRIRVPLLGELLMALDDDQRHVVIDLGPIRSGNLQAFQGLRCRLDILALNYELPLPETREDWLQQLRRWIESWPPQGLERAGLVLCWNLLNYLDSAQIETLFKALAPRMTAEARVHALIESAATSMPYLPAPVALLDRQAISFSNQAPDQRPAPRHSSGLLASALNGFHAERTMMLGNGQREYLFQRDTDLNEPVIPIPTLQNKGKTL